MIIYKETERPEIITIIQNPGGRRAQIRFKMRTNLKSEKMILKSEKMNLESEKDESEVIPKVTGKKKKSKK